jgi:predicted nucleic acid-binding protein
VDMGHPAERSIKMIAYIMGAFIPVVITTKNAPHKPSDPDDEIFLLCAMDGLANFLVSEDSALVNLKSKYSAFVIGRSADLASSLGA